MKQLFIFLTCLMLADTIYAQVGHGIVFRHNPQSGFREVREYDPAASLAKPGKDGNGNQADTIIGYFPIDEASNKIFVKAYPNPVQDVLFVENRSWEDGSTATLKLYDVTGKLLWERTTTQPKESISMNTLPPGNYHVKYYLGYTYLISWKITKI